MDCFISRVLSSQFWPCDQVLVKVTQASLHKTPRVTLCTLSLYLDPVAKQGFRGCNEGPATRGKERGFLGDCVEHRETLPSLLWPVK